LENSQSIDDFYVCINWNLCYRINFREILTFLIPVFSKSAFSHGSRPSKELFFFKKTKQKFEVYTFLYTFQMFSSSRISIYSQKIDIYLMSFLLCAPPKQLYLSKMAANDVNKFISKFLILTPVVASFVSCL
jgi:hypothetical protein